MSVSQEEKMFAVLYNGVLTLPVVTDVKIKLLQHVNWENKSWTADV